MIKSTDFSRKIFLCLIISLWVASFSAAAKFTPNAPSSFEASRPSGDSSTLKNSATLIFAGDIMLDRGVEKQLTAHGFSYPYEKITSLFSSADLVVANLECPLTAVENPISKDPGITFHALPQNAVALSHAGITLLDLANNHTMDQGIDGIESTFVQLKKAGLQYFGAGSNYKEAHEPVLITLNGNSYGFLGFSALPPEGYVYGETRAGISMINAQTPYEIAAAKKKCQFLTVSFHWGNEYGHQASEQQKRLAQTAIDYGADLIIGHHPHVLQEIDQYKEKIILYSLGNFIFDRQKYPETDETALSKCYFSNGSLKKIELLPLRIVEGQPFEVSTKEGAEILRPMTQSLSDALNLQISSAGGKVTLNISP